MPLALDAFVGLAYLQARAGEVIQAPDSSVGSRWVSSNSTPVAR